jgi:hypothetical protein
MFCPDGGGDGGRRSDRPRLKIDWPATVVRWVLVIGCLSWPVAIVLLFID